MGSRVPIMVRSQVDSLSRHKQSFSLNEFYSKIFNLFEAVPDRRKFSHYAWIHREGIGWEEC